MKWEVLDPANSEPLIVQTENGTQAFQFNPDGSVETPSLSTDKGRITEKLTHDFSKANPAFARTFEDGRPPRLDLLSSDPVATTSDPSDVTGVSFIADPFGHWYPDGKYHVLAEVSHDSGTDIGHWTATDPANPSTWTYDQIVLSVTGETLSWPMHFGWTDGEIYMTPDVGSQGGFHIYKKGATWADWSLVENPLSGGADLTDPTIVPFQGTVYLFARDSSPSPTEIRLFYNDSLLGGGWTEHPSSPVHTSNDDLQHGGGRPVNFNDDFVWMPWQLNDQTCVRLFKIHTLTDSAYGDVEVGESPVLSPSNAGDWRNAGHHHVDLSMGGPTGGTFGVVDGNATAGMNDWTLGIVTEADFTPVKFKAYAGTNSLGESGDGFQTQTAPEYDTIDEDDQGPSVSTNFSTSNHHFTAPTDGEYEIYAQVELSNTPNNTPPYSTFAQLRDLTNGAPLKNKNGDIAADGYNPTLSIRWDGDLKEGVVVEAQFRQDSGAAMEARSGLQRSFIKGKRIG